MGTLLFQLVSLVRGRRVFELGSAIGYSTIWLARAVGPGGRVFYTEMDPGRIADARGYLRRAGVLSRVTLLEGPALASLTRTSGTFDAVFCDADKAAYPAYWRAASGVFTVMRTISEPASARAMHWAAVALASAVSVLVMDWTRTGADAPTVRLPTLTSTVRCRVFVIMGETEG